MMWIDVLVLAAKALARAAARIIAWSACWIQLLALMTGQKLKREQIVRFIRSNSVSL